MLLNRAMQLKTLVEGLKFRKILNSHWLKKLKKGAKVTIITKRAQNNADRQHELNEVGRTNCNPIQLQFVCE